MSKLEFEYTCSNCSGNGKVKDWVASAKENVYKNCSNCIGTGKIVVKIGCIGYFERNYGDHGEVQIRPIEIDSNTTVEEFLRTIFNPTYYGGPFNVVFTPTYTVETNKFPTL